MTIKYNKHTNQWEVISTLFFATYAAFATRQQALNYKKEMIG